MESKKITAHEKQETQNLVDAQLQRLYHIIHEALFMCFPKNFTISEVQKIASKGMDTIVQELNYLLTAKIIDNETTSRNTPADCQHDH